MMRSGGMKGWVLLCCKMLLSLLVGVGILGVWGNFRLKKQQPNPPNPKLDKLKLPPGFRAEHLISPSENGTGSWVSMTFDGKGRLIASDQYGALYRLEIPPIGGTQKPVRVEKLTLETGEPLGRAQGLVWAFNSLYAVVNTETDSIFRQGSGLYRFQDTDNNDQFDRVTCLQSFTGFEEHGPHSVVLAPDQKSLYVIAGNFTQTPRMNASRFASGSQRDNLLPDRSSPDGRANAGGGWIARVDSTGSHWELVSRGLRNPFDLAFNEAGELFTYDSDMEWDIGMPWYRPTRICHVTSGSEFGWRDGNAKWSPDWPDNLPPVLNIGQGSPTNLISAHTARFPEKYRRALLAFDWSFGIIYAVHLQPAGASYRAQAEEFLSGAPLPLTDGVIGPDGALYVLTGGRRLESDLYRVYYAGEEHPNLVSKTAEVNRPAIIRRQLEQFHGKPNPAALETAWPYLKDADRFIRYAARVAVEHQPVSQWQDRALTENDPVGRTQALIALARQGDKTVKNRLFDALLQSDFSRLPPNQQLEHLRAIELALLRMGRPDVAQTARLISYLNPQFPARNNALNRELSKLLVFLGAAPVVPKTLALLENAKDDTLGQSTVAQSSDLIFRNPQYGMDLASVLTNIPPALQIHYALVLSEMGNGWTPARRERYFHWYHRAYGYRGGRQYIGYLDKCREEALKTVPREQRAYYDRISMNKPSVDSAIDWVKIMSDGGPGRNWKLAEALTVVQNDATPRSFEQGRLMFAASACNSCHGMRGEGGAIGPDLTQLGTRFSTRDMLESIIDPNKAISDQYAATVFSLQNGNSVIGRLSREDERHYYLSQNPFAPQTLRPVAKKEVIGTRLSKVSFMPPGLVNSLNEERLKDLIAYLVAGGNPDHPVYKTTKKK
ncbi:heme-binding protein [Larkinella insperata]|uniref:Heme-binding protein n=1 Tax=Larkinella insperata TaxID=332158 RepID=A0ABW3QEW8_9BACT